MINAEFRSLDSIEESDNKLFEVCDSLMGYDSTKTIITSRFEFINKKDKIKSNILERIFFLLQRLFNKVGCTKKLDVSREIKNLFTQSGHQMHEFTIENLETIKSVMEILRDKFTRNMSKSHHEILENFALPIGILREVIVDKKEREKRLIVEQNSTIDEQEIEEDPTTPKPSSLLIAQLHHLIDYPFEREESE